MPLETNRADMIDPARIIAMRNNLRSDADLAFALEVCGHGGAQGATLMASELAAAPGKEVTLEAALMQKALEAHVRIQLDSLAKIRTGLG